MSSLIPRSSESVQEFNPYAAPPQQLTDPSPGDSDDEVMRRTYLSHETTVKSIGICYLFFGAVVFSGAVGMALVPRQPGDLIAAVFIGVVAPIAGFAFMVTGYGMHQLRRWSRPPTGLISGIGLIGVPFWTLINGYILYVVFCARGRTVFSDEYREIIRQTPHIRYNGWIVVWILFTILVALMGAAVGVTYLLRLLM